MPELPDLEAYLAALRARLVGSRFVGLRLASPVFLSTVEPAPAEWVGREVRALARLGKRLVVSLDGPEPGHLVLHLMIAGRLRFAELGAKIPARIGLAALDFSTGTLLVTEASTKRRARLALARDLAAHDPGGLEPLTLTAAEFADRLRSESHTLKRALTDPRLFAGIGNAYSDEILFAARLSPLRRTRDLEDAEVERLHRATVEVLTRWRDELVGEATREFPSKVTAFREGMAVHGRRKLPCTVCGAPIQRIVHAETESNYCANCQVGGRLLADRSLSRLLKEDWPRSLAELEERRRSAEPGAPRPPGRK